MEKKIEAAAEKYSELNYATAPKQSTSDADYIKDVSYFSFKSGVYSDAAKEYWQAQFQQTQNNVWVKASERLPDSNFHVNMFCCRYVMISNEYYNWNVHKIKEMLESSYEIEWLDESYKTISEEEIKALAEKEFPMPVTGNKFGEQELCKQHRDIYIKGFKSCLNYKK